MLSEKEVENILFSFKDPVTQESVKPPVKFIVKDDKLFPCNYQTILKFYLQADSSRAELERLKGIDIVDYAKQEGLSVTTHLEFLSAVERYSQEQSVLEGQVRSLSDHDAINPLTRDGFSKKNVVSGDECFQIAIGAVLYSGIESESSRELLQDKKDIFKESCLDAFYRFQVGMDGLDAKQTRFLADCGVQLDAIPILVLLREANSSSDLLSVIHHPDIERRVLTLVAMHSKTNDAVYTELVQHPLVTEDLMSQVVVHLSEKALAIVAEKTRLSTTLVSVSNHPNANEAVLTHVMRNPAFSWDTQVIVAKHRCATPEILTELVNKTKEPELFPVIMRHPATDEQVLRAIIDNRQTQKTTLTWIAKRAINPEVSESAKQSIENRSRTLFN